MPTHFNKKSVPFGIEACSPKTGPKKFESVVVIPISLQEKKREMGLPD